MSPRERRTDDVAATERSVPTAAEARAEVESRRDEQRAARAARLAGHFGDVIPGRAIIAVSWVCTLAFVAVSVFALIDPDAAIGAFFAVSFALFLAGCALFALVLVLAAARSRDDAMGIGGLFFLAGSAPRAVQWHLLGALAVQTVVAVAVAAVHPFTSYAFGTLVPTVGLAFCGLWSVRHGLFERRSPQRR